MFRCWTKKPELGWTRSSWLNLRKGSRQSRNFCRNFLMIQFRLRQCYARWLKQVNWEERWRSLISKISWKGEHGCQTCVCSSVDFPQDECWTSIKQSQIWSSACHGQWWRWWPWRPIIFLIFCKQLWSKWKDHTKTHCHPDWYWFFCDDLFPVATFATWKNFTENSCNHAITFFLHTLTS